MMFPPIIQGGMGIAVSGWRLSGAVSRLGQFGVVSGSGLAVAFARRLQLGDPEGHLRGAMAKFPVTAVRDRVMQRWFIEGGKARSAAYAAVPMSSYPMDPALSELLVLANFVEIYLAKVHGGTGPIGLNLLTKIEIFTLPSLYGAMLADVDAIFMGAGIPRSIPGVLDAFAAGQDATITLSVEGGSPSNLVFSPRQFCGPTPPALRRPAFFPIVSSATLANIMIRKSNGRLDGFVIENHTAGGHNAPPRRSDQRNGRGEPVWGDHDRPELAAFRKLGLPFYLAGGQADNASLRAIQAQGGHGIQIGTAFAFCHESGIDERLRAAVLRAAARGELDVLTDANASPTGFPFKVVQLPHTLSDAGVYAGRPRACELGFLRSAYATPDGTIGWRCPAERQAAYLAKGGKSEDTVGCKCLCAGLGAAAGLGQTNGTYAEPCILTAGDDVRHLSRFLRPGHDGYSARDVVASVLGSGETR